MEAKYNPIVRIFGRFRAALMSCSGIPRHEICPAARLDQLLPVDRRRDIWERLRGQGLLLPDLVTSPAVSWTSSLGVLGLAGTVALALHSWLGLLVFFPFGGIAYRATRPYAVHFPGGLTTVGELVVCLASFKDHKESGHRWTREEISLKVRVLIAKHLNVPLDKVRPETTWQELAD